LPRRPAVRPRPDLPGDRRPAGAGAAGGDVRPRPHTGRVVPRLPLGHRAHRLGGDAPRGGGVTSPQTPGQTVGPFFAFGLEYDGDSALVPPGSPGAIRLHGRVLDGDREPRSAAALQL